MTADGKIANDLLLPYRTRGASCLQVDRSQVVPNTVLTAACKRGGSVRWSHCHPQSSVQTRTAAVLNLIGIYGGADDPVHRCRRSSHTQFPRCSLANERHPQSTADRRNATIKFFLISEFNGHSYLVCLLPSCCEQVVSAVR